MQLQCRDTNKLGIGGSLVMRSIYSAGFFSHLCAWAGAEFFEVVSTTAVGFCPIGKHVATEGVPACGFDAAAVAERYFTMVSVFTAKKMCGLASGNGLEFL